MFFEKSWNLVARGAENTVKLFGIKIFEYEWHRTGEEVSVPEFSGTATVYTIKLRGKTRRFAAIETNYGVWAFYLYQWTIL